MHQENAFVLEASLTIPISAGIKTKSAINAARRVTKRTNVAATVNQVVENSLWKTHHMETVEEAEGKILDVSHEHQ